MHFSTSEARRRNHNSILNTATGEWLGDACDEIDRLRERLRILAAENERLVRRLQNLKRRKKPEPTPIMED